MGVQVVNKKNGQLCIWIIRKKKYYGYAVVRTIGDHDYHKKILVDKNKMPGNWFDILINVKWTKKEWFF